MRRPASLRCSDASQAHDALAAYHDTTGFDCGHPALDTFLAVERSEQGAGLGEALLKDAIKRHLQAQSIIGSRALVAHAKDERAAAFYARHGFQPSPTDPLHLYLLTKDMKKTLGLK